MNSRERESIWSCIEAHSASHKRTRVDSFLYRAGPWESSCTAALYDRSKVASSSSRRMIASSRLCGTRIHGYCQYSVRTSAALSSLVLSKWSNQILRNTNIDRHFRTFVKKQTWQTRKASSDRFSRKLGIFAKRTTHHRLNIFIVTCWMNGSLKSMQTGLPSGQMLCLSFSHQTQSPRIPRASFGQTICF